MSKRQSNTLKDTVQHMENWILFWIPMLKIKAGALTRLYFHHQFLIFSEQIYSKNVSETHFGTVIDNITE